MKFTTSLLALFCATIVSAQAQIPLDIAVDPSLKVPGGNPLNYCDTPTGYILQLHNLDLNPKKPVAGQPLHIHATGNLTKVVEKGSLVHVKVKMGLIPLLNKYFDLCENAKAVNEKCPFEKGFWDVSKKVDMPKEIPPAKFTVRMEAYTNDTEAELISCMEGAVDFSRRV